MFETERQPLAPLEHKGKTYQFYARELGFYQVQEIFGRKHAENQTLTRMRDLVLACIETEDQKPAFNGHTWALAPKHINEACVAAALKAQGFEDVTGEASEGND